MVPFAFNCEIPRTSVSRQLEIPAGPAPSEGHQSWLRRCRGWAHPHSLGHLKLREISMIHLIHCDLLEILAGQWQCKWQSCPARCLCRCCLQALPDSHALCISFCGMLEAFEANSFVSQSKQHSHPGGQARYASWLKVDGEVFRRDRPWSHLQPGNNADLREYPSEKFQSWNRIMRRQSCWKLLAPFTSLKNTCLLQFGKKMSLRRHELRATVQVGLHCVQG